MDKVFQYFSTHGYNKKEILSCIDNISKNYDSAKVQTVIKSEVELDIIIKSLGDIERIPIIRAIYSDACVFPEWTYNTIKENPDLKPLVTVYYDNKDDVSIIRKLCIQREPVNMEQVRYYDMRKLKEKFGWDVGLYQKIWNDRKILAPNFAIYCKTPVVCENKTYSNVHIINSIGAALDSRLGPDYNYFIPDKIDDLFPFYRKVFLYIFECALEKNLPNVCMSLVGANNFAQLYPGGQETFQDYIWIPTFIEIHRKYNINVVFMGANQLFIQRIAGRAGYGGYKNVGNFPDLLNSIDVNDTLIVNSWDPFSFVGNGNACDPSLDGDIGMRTACSMLCWPKVNSQMKYIPLEIES